MNLDEVVELMRDSKPRMTLDVEFDVADSVVPASGVYWLKLVKPAGSSSTFGITLQGNIFPSFEMFSLKRKILKFHFEQMPKRKERTTEVWPSAPFFPDRWPTERVPSKLGTVSWPSTIVASRP